MQTKTVVVITIIIFVIFFIAKIYNNKKRHIKLYFGKQTNYDNVLTLGNIYPNSFLEVQRLLVAVQDYITIMNNISFEDFNSNFTNFLNALEKDGVINRNDTFAKTKINIIKYLDKISETFPNWQREYTFLDVFINNTYGRNATPVAGTGGGNRVEKALPHVSGDGGSGE